MNVNVTYLYKQLIVEFGVGVAVLVRCFVDKRGTENQITDRLGVGFTRIPFIIVVVWLLHSSVTDSIHL